MKSLFHRVLAIALVATGIAALPCPAAEPDRLQEARAYFIGIMINTFRHANKLSGRDIPGAQLQAMRRAAEAWFDWEFIPFLSSTRELEEWISIMSDSELRSIHKKRLSSWNKQQFYALSQEEMQMIKMRYPAYYRASLSPAGKLCLAKLQEYIQRELPKRRNHPYNRNINGRRKSTSYGPNHSYRDIVGLSYRDSVGLMENMSAEEKWIFVFFKECRPSQKSAYRWDNMSAKERKNFIKYLMKTENMSYGERISDTELCLEYGQYKWENMSAEERKSLRTTRLIEKKQAEAEIIRGCEEWKRNSIRRMSWDIEAEKASLEKRNKSLDFQREVHQRELDNMHFRDTFETPEARDAATRENLKQVTPSKNHPNFDPTLYKNDSGEYFRWNGNEFKRL